MGLGSGAICGGEGATVSIDDMSKGLDFGRDYCHSGESIRELRCACGAHRIATVGMATQNGSRYWLCAPGPDPLSPLPTASTAHASTIPTNVANPTALPISNVGGNKSKLIGPIIGGVVGAFLLLCLALFWRYRKRTQDQGLYRVDAWKHEDDSGPSPLLHRRGMSEQSNMTTRTSQSTATTQSHITPYSAERSPESMRSPVVSGPAKFALIQERLNAAAAASPSTETSENSDMLSQDSHVPLMRKTSAGPDTPRVPSLIASVPTPPEDVHFIPPPIPPLPSNIPIPTTPPTVSFVTSPSRSRHRPKSRNPSTSSLPRSQITSASVPSPPPPPLPNSPPISPDVVEQRLLELRDEADRGLAEIRAQRGVSLIGEMPPPYHLP